MIPSTKSVWLCVRGEPALFFRLLEKLFLAFILVVPGIAFAKESCEGILSLSQRQFWSRTEPVLVPTPEDMRPLTFSFDSEIPVSSAFRILREHPDLDAKVFELVAKYPLDRASLIRNLRMSEAQFKSFALVPGVDVNRGHYFLSDLTAMAWKAVSELQYRSEALEYQLPPGLDLDGGPLAIETRQGGTFIFDNDMKSQLVDFVAPLLTEALKRKGWELFCNRDGHELECRHSSYTTSPHDIFKMVSEFHRLFPAAQTHLHLGLPAGVPREKMALVLRGGEAPMILDLAVDGGLLPDPVNRPASTLVDILEPNRSAHGGAISYYFERWEVPFPTHDIEVRQHLSLKRAFRQLQFFVLLAVSYEKLKDFGLEFHATNSGHLYDRVTYNLDGALHYAGAAFTGSSVAEEREVGSELLRFKDRIIDPNVAWGDRLNDDLREEIRAFLKQNEIVDRYRLELLLE